MIDIHTHILPSVDDGAGNMAESLVILKKAGESGVTTVVATPHVLIEQFTKEYHNRICASFHKLNELLAFEGIDIELVLGAELYLIPELPQLVKENSNLSLGGGDYVLMELPMHEIPSYTEHVIYELLVQGKTPIIAHPERYREIQEDIENLFKLVEKGVIVQINVGSLMGMYGRHVKKTVHKLLNNNLVHLMASDIHRNHDKLYPLQQGIKLASKIIGKQRALKMVTSVPNSIIYNSSCDLRCGN